MLQAGTKIKLNNKIFLVIEVTEFGAKIRPIIKIGRGTYKAEPKTRAIFISANTQAEVIKW